MANNYRKKSTSTLSPDTFFASNAGSLSYEDFARRVYHLVHTYYLSPTKSIKSEMGKAWSSEFDTYMTDETFDYLLRNDPILLRNILISETEKRQAIKSNLFIEKTLVALEFDLWMLECFKHEVPIVLEHFQTFLSDKYGTYLNSSFQSYQKFNLQHIVQYEELAKSLYPFHTEIQTFHQLFIKNNHAKIHFQNANAEYLPLPASSIPISLPENTADSTPAPPPVSVSPAIPESEITALRASLDREYHLLLKEKEEQIEKLKKDLAEFKRQCDNSRKFSNTQYARGIKDFFAALNNAKYGKIINYFFSLLQNSETEETLASYLDNFFMALEDLEIKPIPVEAPHSIKESSLLKQYNLDFDKSQYDPSLIRTKYVGWTYKLQILEKPTLTMEE